MTGNGSHLELLDQLKMRDIIGVKPDDHNYLFEFVQAVKMEEKEEQDRNGILHRYRWFNHAPLNDMHIFFNPTVHGSIKQLPISIAHNG